VADVKTLFSDVVSKHKKASEAVAKLATEKEMREEELGRLLTKFNTTYGETLTVEQIPSYKEKIGSEIKALEQEVIAGCESFLTTWNSGVAKV
jgi:hypothetical protein